MFTSLLSSLGSKVLGLLPLNQMAEMVMSSSLGDKLLAPIAKIYQKTHGVRSQGLLGVAAALYVASMAGWLPWETSTPLIKDLLIASGVTFADKLLRYLGPSEKVQEAVDAASKAP